MIAFLKELFKEDPEPPVPRSGPIRPVITKIVAMIDAEDFTEGYSNCGHWQLKFAGSTSLPCSVLLHQWGDFPVVYVGGSDYRATESERSIVRSAVVQFNLRRAKRVEDAKAASQAEATKTILAYQVKGEAA